MLVAGIASDLLDAGVMLAEWGRIPPGKRMPGIAAALGTAAAGVALLARSDVTARTGPPRPTV